VKPSTTALLAALFFLAAAGLAFKVGLPWTAGTCVAGAMLFAAMGYDVRRRS
jgi:hypothetical protein